MSKEEKIHIPVMKEEVLKYLDVQENKNFIDCTFGEGGHTELILAHNKPNGKVLAIELDPDLYKIGTKRFQDFIRSKRLILVNDSYTNLISIVQRYKFYPINGILFDLGASMWHFKMSKRGFSFRENEPLDMRYNPKTQSLTAFEIVNYWPQKHLEEIFKEFGEEKYATKIAQNICEYRKRVKIQTTGKLVEIIRKSIPLSYQKRRKIHFATKIFQALRIAVNSELSNIKKGLEEASKIITPGGRIVVISFHSLEDRIVKQYFKKLAKEKKASLLTKKPIKPKKVEILQNPSARSAKLRAIIITKQ